MPSSPLRDLIRLARPSQWSKGAFVLVGPLYAFVKEDVPATTDLVIGAAAAFLAFGFASSACYVFNDLRDRDADRAHPRKRNRPIASGAVSPAAAVKFSGFLLLLAFLSAAAAGIGASEGSFGFGRPSQAVWLLVTLGVYIFNTTLYSIALKHLIVADVMSLALGFVIRVLGGCAATGVTPSPWLLNVVFFFAMFLAFGKRLGERRTMGSDAATARAVQTAYTDDLLRMSVVVTGVATLITYAGYVQGQGSRYELGFNLLWLTMLPATYGLLRCIVLLERGEYDDPTELAWRDRPMQLAVGVFLMVTLAVMVGLHGRAAGP